MKPLLILIAVLLAFGAFAGTIEVTKFDNPQQERLYKKLIAELRCLVCVSQNIADSNADMAKDLRHRTYELVKANKSEQEIIDFMVTRYGDYVLYRPPLKLTTLILWFGPFLLLLVGILVIWRILARRSNEGEDAAPLSEADRQRAESLLKGDGDD